MEERDYFINAVKLLARDAGFRVEDMTDHLRIDLLGVSDNEYHLIVNHLNEQAGTQFKWATNATQAYLRTLFREGYTRADIELVINHKVKEWKHDNKMAQYLRPATLFNKNKFEGYLQVAKLTPKASMYDLLKDDWE